MTWSRRLVVLDAVLVSSLVVGFFVYPAVRTLLSLSDPALSGPGIPASAWRQSKGLSTRYAEWATARVGKGAVSTEDVAGTEWPLFGSLFFLWGVENLQVAWDGGDHSAGVEPRVFAREAVIAASELVIDPAHAEWVRQKWGPGYLHRQNVFYRMLVIGSLTTRARLLNDGAHLEVLRDQVESLAAELDASPSGLLEDYPGEIYPGDVLAAVVCIRRADAVLGTDHSAFVARMRRAFSERSRHGLPPFSAQPTSEPRGSGTSYLLLLAPEVWPDEAQRWYAAYDAHFFQHRWSAAGFREFSRELHGPEWFVEIDAGPVLAGHGISASAFGVGAARRNGRFDHAFPLMTEMLASSWELPGGILAGPRVLSNATDAPLLGEAAVFWLSTVQPAPGVTVTRGGSVPLFTFVVLLGPLMLGVAFAWQRLRRARAWLHVELPFVKAQLTAWVVVTLAGVVVMLSGGWWAGLLLLAFSTFVPVASTSVAAARQDDPSLLQRAAS